MQILCKTPAEVKKCTKIIQKWSEINGMKLNKKKSGLVVFALRSAHTIPYMMLRVEQNQKDKSARKEWVPSTQEIRMSPYSQQI